MKGRKVGTAMVCAVCVCLIVSAFFAKDFVLYDYHMNVSDYHYAKTEEEIQPDNKFMMHGVCRT